MSQPPVERPPGNGPLRREAEAARAARMELGPEYEDAIAAGLAERMEELAAYRTAELRLADDRARRDTEYDDRGRTQRFVLVLVSLGAGVPITAIAGNVVDPGLAGVVVAWAGIVGVNLVYALTGRRPHR